MAQIPGTKIIAKQEEVKYVGWVYDESSSEAFDSMYGKDFRKLIKEARVGQLLWAADYTQIFGEKWFQTK